MSILIVIVLILLSVLVFRQYALVAFYLVLLMAGLGLTLFILSLFTSVALKGYGII